MIARHGARVVSGGLVVALAALGGQLLDIHLSGTATDAARLAPLFFAIGVGNGFVIPALIGVSLTDVAPQKAGAAAGTLATGQQFATAAGVAVLSEIFFAALGHAPTEHAYLDAIQYVIVLDVGLLVACIRGEPASCRARARRARRPRGRRAGSSPRTAPRRADRAASPGVVRRRRLSSPAHPGRSPEGSA